MNTINPIACHCTELERLAQNDKLIPLTTIYSRVFKKIRVNIHQNAIITCASKQPHTHKNANYFIAPCIVYVNSFTSLTALPMQTNV